ncbi:MAG: hypothetical protein WDO70_05445 [Alphaproteobacteria bacterium]
MNLDEELDNLTKAFIATKQALADGAFIDLTSMDQRIKDLCDHVVAADAETRERIKAGFLALLELIKEMETDMRAKAGRGQ